MNQEENVEGQGDRPEETTPNAGENPAAGQEPRRHDSRRGRFRRGGRGRRGRGGGGGRETRAERPPERPADDNAPPQSAGEERAPKSSGTIRDLIDDVSHIQSELEKALDDLNEVLRTLETAEREKNASEHEIEILRESIRKLRGDRGYQQSRSSQAYRPDRPVSTPPARAEAEPEPEPKHEEPDEPEAPSDHDEPDQAD